MITRRTLLKAGGCALVAYAGAPRFLLRAAHAAEASGKVLVAIFQRGAVDGLSMVMPYGDSGYAGVRPSIGLALPRTLQGDVGAISMQSLDRFDVRNGDDGTARQGFESLYEQGVRDLLHGTGRETFDAVKMLRSARASRIAPAHGAEYPRVPLGEALRQIAQLIKANVGLEVAFADMQGWDTHVGQGAERGQLALRLRDFGAALAAFAQDLGDKMSDVVVLTMSEFGRTVAENGNRGTDHGHATAMLVLGGGVRGGRVYGRWPGLAHHQLFEGRDLAVTTDFRTLFSEIATRHLGVPSAPIFPGFRSAQPPLGILA